MTVARVVMFCAALSFLITLVALCLQPSDWLDETIKLIWQFGTFVWAGIADAERGR